MSPFKAHGIEHLSASQLTTFCADSSYWFASRVLGFRTPSSAAMERGKAVETGVVQALLGDAFDEACRAAFEQFDKAAMFGGLSGDCDKERAAIEPMIEQGLDALSGFGKPEFPEDGGQHRIEIPVRFGDGEDDIIPIIGFLDLVFEDRIVDLKSTHRIPSEMSFSHRLQAVIYQRVTGNRPVEFCYVSPKKHSILRPENIAADQELVRQIVKRMARFLSLGDTETLREAVPIVFDSWSWRGFEADRKRMLGA